MRAYAFQNLDGDFWTPYRDGDRLLLAWVGVAGDDERPACDFVFALLNQDDRPNRYVAPSLSVGDVITFAHDDGGITSWAVERDGFRNVPEIVPDAAQAAAYHEAVREAEDLLRPVMRPEQVEAGERREAKAVARREGRTLPPVELGQQLLPTRELDAVREWLGTTRARLVDDSDAYADVDLIYNLYRAITGEDIDHPWEGDDDD